MATMTEYRTATAAAKAYALSRGWVGRKGGWIYYSADENARTICQGWASLVGILTREGVLVDLDGSRLGTRSDTPKDPRDRWAGLRRNVFDGKPVALVAK